MATSATNSGANDPLRKAYMDISNTVNNLNRKVTFYNINSVIKTQALFTACFAIGYLTAWAATALFGMTAGVIVALPIAVLGSLALGGYVCDKMESSCKKKIADIHRACIKSMKKFNHDINKAMNLVTYRKAALPYTISKIKLDSFETVQNRYDNRPFINKWTPNFLRFA